jgi:membrane protein implicated in regulation of membrane protease activity
MSARHIFALPLACAALMLGGLVVALVDEGAADMSGAVAIALPLLLLGRRALRPRDMESTGRGNG